ncbi:MAG: hypothetical protein A2284_10845 [Deltaproteobacteria bacterium RIFOXYA12_FULL_61_11]|nr:MAG: hypothetical protein A2284_10845 [Deltaproteobacteria bacterium RIFOXYA12_FULL_61_11]
MSEFWQALQDYPFLRNALIAGLLTSVACGIVGPYVVVRRIGYLGGGIAHAVFGGLGLVHWANTVHGTSIHPLLGATAFALLAALLIGWIDLSGKRSADTAIGALWAVGMAVGLLFLARTPGYALDLTSYLFGNILMVDHSDLVLICILDLCIIVVGGLGYRRLVTVCFDQRLAAMQGQNVPALSLLLLVLVALTVVALVRIVGLILVIALLSLPAAIVLPFVGSMFGAMMLAIVLGALFTTSGLAASFVFDLPTGAVIILLAGLVYFLSLGLARWTKR